MSELPTASSFTSLATIPLAQPHFLHPEACNPTMDLVVLLSEDLEDKAKPPAFGTKGKGRSGPGVATKVELWRMSGSKVWEVMVTGRVLGLAWSRDGSYLSLLVLNFLTWTDGDDIVGRESESSVEHLTVHTGETVKTVPIPVSFFERTMEAADWRRAERPPRFKWWPMSWVEEGEKWEDPKPGSSLMVIDSLPRVTPVDPPKPAIINPFAPVIPAEVYRPGMHPSLATFPSLLPTNPLMPPDVLVVCTEPRSESPERIRLLTGSFYLVDGTADPPPATTLSLAQRADALERFLDVILRGIQVCATAFRDSEKQTMIWREELEECGQQQDMTVAEVHADLFRFFMTGRCGPAVNEWLGNRMMNRTVAKWEASLDTAYSTIQKLIHQSISPALERILLILEELLAWSSDIADCEITLREDTIRRAMEIARGMLVLMETMRLDSETEYTASDEWCRWLRYEMARANTTGDESAPIPTHDLKLAWSFMKNGFMGSKFRFNFPNDPDAKTDVLPENVPSQRDEVPVNLDSMMRSTLARLTSSSSALELIPSPTVPDQSFASSHGTPPRERTPEIMSSPDTVGSPVRRAEEPTTRRQELEPWSWANALIAQCNDIIDTVRPRHPETSDEWNAVSKLVDGTLLSERVIDGQRWILSKTNMDTVNVLISAEGLRGARLCVADAQIVQAAFFDDEELAVVFRIGNMQHLATIAISSVQEMLSEPLAMDRRSVEMIENMAPSPITISRCRALGTTRTAIDEEPWLLALNGRPGRRTGCILTRGGSEVEILDLADDEGEEEEEGDEDDVEMED